MRHIAYNALDPETMLLFYTQVFGLREIPSSYLNAASKGAAIVSAPTAKPIWRFIPFYSQIEGHEAKYGINHIGFLTNEMQGDHGGAQQRSENCAAPVKPPLC